jgi:hypothetical protein
MKVALTAFEGTLKEKKSAISSIVGGDSGESIVGLAGNFGPLCRVERP